MPPDMPAAKLRPTGPRTTTRPPVMYSQPWSPTPSTTTCGAGVAHAEALAGGAQDEGLAGRRAVERDVAADDVLVGVEAGAARRVEDGRAPGEALAEVVVGLALELDGQAARREGHERLAGRARRRAGGWCPRAARPRPCGASISLAQHRAHRAVDVADGEARLHALAPLQRRAPRGARARCRGPPPGRGPGPCCGRCRSAPWPAWVQEPREVQLAGLVVADVARAAPACPRARPSRPRCRKPRRAMCSRRSSAMKRKKVRRARARR